MTEIEKDARTRVRKNGKDEDRVTGNLLWDAHTHRTARPVEGFPDASLHRHVLVFNITFDPVERRYKAVQLGDIVRDKGYYQAVADSRFASKLKALGYGIHKDGKTFRIAGIDKATSDKFSRRTAIIEAEAERLRIEDAATKDSINPGTGEKEKR